MSTCIPVRKLSFSRRRDRRLQRNSVSQVGWPKNSVQPRGSRMPGDGWWLPSSRRGGGSPRWGKWRDGTTQVEEGSGRMLNRAAARAESPEGTFFVASCVLWLQHWSVAMTTLVRLCAAAAHSSFAAVGHGALTIGRLGTKLVASRQSSTNNVWLLRSGSDREGHCAAGCRCCGRRRTRPHARARHFASAASVRVSAE